MTMQAFLRRDDRGIGAVEFALIAPVLISFIIGISQMGKVFFANADMKNALASGARVASVWPVPDDATILAAVNDRLARSDAADDAEAEVVHGEDNGNPYIELRMTYSVPLEFIFFSAPPVTLSDSRRVFTQVTNANGTTYGASTTTGGTTSATSASSSGASTSTSATSASTSSTTTTSSGNASSGNNNGSSGDHDHGNCNKKC